MNSSASSVESLQEADSTIISQKEDDVKSYSMMTPAEKLSVCERRVQSLADREAYDGCIQELVRCLALSRLVYGNEHFAVVQAQSRLAKAYLQYKGWPHQAEEHASQALEVLSSSQQGERVSYLKCCLSAHQTLGSATLFLGNLAKAESSFQEAKTIMGDIVAQEAILDTDTLDTEYEISTNLARFVFPGSEAVELALNGGSESGISDAGLKSCQGDPAYTLAPVRRPQRQDTKEIFDRMLATKQRRHPFPFIVWTQNQCKVYQRQGRAEEALSQCEKALELLRDGGQLSRNCLIYRNMAAIEQTQGHLDRAIEHLLQAHSIALSQSPGGLEEAHIAHSLALAYSSTSEPQHNDSAAQYFEESISAYKSALGPRDTLTLSVQDDYSHFLLLTGEQEKSAQIQRESLALKKSTFGELSTEMTEALQLIGGVEMTRGQMRHAHRTLRKCLDIQIMLYGPQHKKTKATQRTVDMLFQSPEVHGSHKRESQLETRPPFCAVVSSPTELKSSISNL